jgi:hypothetical protein
MTKLVRLGADGITTTCGFLSLYQREISAHIGVPVATSSLMQIPLIERVLPPTTGVAGSAPAASRCSSVRLSMRAHARERQVSARRAKIPTPPAGQAG